jgi:hypothetical protein
MWMEMSRENQFAKDVIKWNMDTRWIAASSLDEDSPLIQSSLNHLNPYHSFPCSYKLGTSLNKDVLLLQENAVLKEKNCGLKMSVELAKIFHSMVRSIKGYTLTI